VCFPEGIAYGRFEMKVYLRAKGSYCLLAESGGNVAGFILAELAPDEGHIITLDVLENCRRQGIGSLLLDAGEKEAAARGGRRMVLETATTNKAAIALWRKHGYREIATLQNYYGRGRNALKMAKQIGAMLDNNGP
jgi:ribosomal protein S18 acetylase RimI-like enzyme